MLDTSAIIDGRFVEMHRARLPAGRSHVFRGSCLANCRRLPIRQTTLDAREGVEGSILLAALPESERVEVFETDYNDTAAVDEKLLRLSADAKSALVTVDYNLAKVARVRGIEVLNLNDAAGALRPNFLPGESIHLKIVKPGKEAEQGVGYLDDGTMVVVQGGRSTLGPRQDVEVTSVLQTSAGRMVFARVGAARRASKRQAHD